ncbi:site-specific integrase [uncultured Roseibium sp.]|uniref:site-specific integrase n=1 Tax=uncultured Roseibium sp. TaxID=1936171 RepID=UPI002633F815|nr:site-specific integrase [uncultured Roseibium sp.]
MPSHKLTKRTVDAIAPLTKTRVHYDSELKGFGVRVTPSGHKAWVVEYRPGGGRNTPTKRMTLGRTGTLTPDEARRKAREILASALLGGDPALEKSDARKMPTLAQFAETFIRDHVDVKLKKSTASTYRDHLERLIVPEIGSIKLDQLTRKRVSALHSKIGTKSPGIANRMLATLSSMFGFAAIKELVPEGFNPTRKIEKFPENQLERFLSSDEIRRIGEAICEGETTGIPWVVDETHPKSKHVAKAENRFTLIDRYAAAAIRLLLLTGARRGEILALKWENVDVEHGLLHLPDSKTGKKTIVLNAAAAKVLADLPRLGSYVIAGREPDTPRHDLKKPWAAVLRRAGVKNVRLHDLRHTHASFGVNAGMGLPIVGKLLGHSRSSTTERYAHLADDPVRQASEDIGCKLSAALEGKGTDAGSSDLERSP